MMLLGHAATGLAQQATVSEAEPLDPGRWETMSPNVTVSWASRDEHYAPSAVPRLRPTKDLTLRAWRGERLSAQAVVMAKEGQAHVALSVVAADDASAGLARATHARYVSYVLCDEKRGCGQNPMTSPTYLVPDIISQDSVMTIGERSTRPVWVTVEVPRDLAAGRHELLLVVDNHQTVSDTLRLHLDIVGRTLPQAKDYAFHTDFWQQPYSVSRYYQVPRWSQRHFDLLRPYLRLLARGGQKVVTAILFYEPWGEQSNDKFDPMIRTTRLKNGKWKYDYSVFDHYVELCDSCGINGQINCYSMIPWDMSFRYHDQATGKDIDLKTTTDAADYRKLWEPFLKSFARHLKKKGWMERTCIAMDERGLADMQRAYALLHEAVPEMRMSLAGNRHHELVDKIYDYSLGFPQRFTPEELRQRDSLHLVSTAYTCCPDLTPNLETYNAPADAAYLPLYCVANGFGGYLHWSWMNWTDRPLQDSRFKLFPPGDTYLIYPGPRSSVRWERYIEGVEQVEKIYQLRQAYREQGNDKALLRLEQALRPFASGELNYQDTSARLINRLEAVVNEP